MVLLCNDRVLISQNPQCTRIRQALSGSASPLGRTRVGYFHQACLAHGPVGPPRPRCRRVLPVCCAQPLHKFLPFLAPLEECDARVTWPTTPGQISHHEKGGAAAYEFDMCIFGLGCTSSFQGLHWVRSVLFKWLTDGLRKSSPA